MAPKRRGGMGGPYEPRPIKPVHRDSTGLGAVNPASIQPGAAAESHARAIEDTAVGTAAGSVGTAPEAPETTLVAADALEPIPVEPIAAETIAAEPISVESLPAEQVRAEPTAGEPAPATPATPPALVAKATPAESPTPSSPTDTVEVSASLLGALTGAGLVTFVGGGLILSGLGAAWMACYSIGLADQYLKRLGEPPRGPGRSRAA